MPGLYKSTFGEGKESEARVCLTAKDWVGEVAKGLRSCLVVAKLKIRTPFRQCSDLNLSNIHRETNLSREFVKKAYAILLQFPSKEHRHRT
jgi:hypothetical protein